MRPLIMAFLTVAVLACSESPHGQGDTGEPLADAAQGSSDSAVSFPDGSSANEPDAAALGEATDAALLAADASPAPEPDAATSSPDASAGSACAAQFAGCTAYVDATAANANRTLSFSGQQYSPKCLEIAAGQSVTFSGSFSFHPLEQACGPSEVITPTRSGSTKSFVLETPGEYGYFCTAHGTSAGTGMAGSIRVR